MRSKVRAKILLGVTTSLLFVLSMIALFSQEKTYRINEENVSAVTVKAVDTKKNEGNNITYLSDLDAIQATSGYGNIVKDATQSGGKITVKVEGSYYAFEKGIFAHAPSTLVYDLGENHDYDWFTAYLGLNNTASAGNGVKFYIYTAGEDREYQLQTNENGMHFLPGSNSQFVKINVKGVRYLKLYASDNSGNGHDHSVYADAKLVKGTPVEESLPSPEEYDQLLKTKYANATFDNEEYELTLLQRNLIKNMGNFTLVLLQNSGQEVIDAFHFIFDDVDNLRMYTMGGKPSGTYINSFKVLSELYQVYQEDLTRDDLTENGTRYGDVYKRMMMAISLTHSKQVRFWIRDRNENNQVVNDPNSYNVSKPVDRYAAYKKMLEANKLHAMFETLEIEEMRLVVNVELADNEIEWLRDFTNAKGTMEPYPYIAYVHDRGYWQARHYVDMNTPTDTGVYRPIIGPRVETWAEKYLLNGYGFQTQPYYPHLWMVMDEGGVCWQTANLGQNMRAVWGIPSVVLGQPGHSVFGAYNVSGGKVLWGIGNDISSWPGTNLTGYNNINTYHKQRVLVDWGSGSYASGNNASYILLGQEAINNMTQFTKAEEYVQLATVYDGDLTKQEQIYRAALREQNINLDAWLGLINTYKNNASKTEADYYNLAREVAEALTYAPLPMYDMLRLISAKIASPEYISAMTMLQTKTLKNGAAATANNHDQYGTVRQMANHLLGIVDKEVAVFSFDGQDAGKIKLGSKYSETMPLWEYSIDGGTTWTYVEGAKEVQLTEEQLAHMTAEYDVKVHIEGIPRSEETVFVIDIVEGTLPSLYGNDLENRVIGATTSLEWRYSEEDDWVSYQVDSPVLTGDVTIEVRNGATGRSLPSISRQFTFTEDNQPEDRKYVPVSHLSIHGVSSEATGGGQYGNAVNSIDGNYNTRWHSAWNGSDSAKWIIIKLDQPIYLSAIEYVPADGGNGKILNAKFEGSMDGETFDIDLGTTSIWGDDRYWGGATATRTIDYTEEYKQNLVQYIKITGTRTSSAGGGNFIAARMFNIYQDVTKNPHPTAGIAYSTTEPTRGEVIARLVNKSTDFTITNNDGSDTYIFTKNGTFTFEFEDAKGNKGTAMAKVSNIDHKAPTATIKYNPATTTNLPVTATLTNISEDAYLLDENNRKVNYIEVANKKVLHIDYLNEVGNITKTLNLNEEGETESITYFYQNIQYIVAYDEKGLVQSETFLDQEGNSIDPENKEEIRKLNEIGRSKPLSYEFIENGTHIFRLQDKAGNISDIEAQVDYITDVKATIVYSTTEPTTGEVIATITFNQSGIQILNNGGSGKYTFYENGEFTFKYMDRKGNTGSLTAKVSWITKEDHQEPAVQPGNQGNDNASLSGSETSKKPLETKNYSLENIMVSVSSQELLKGNKLNKRTFELSTDLKTKIGTNYESFELYFTNEKNRKVEFELAEMKMTIELDPKKKFVDIYEVRDNNLVKVDYVKIGDKLEFKAMQLGKYVIEYQEEEKEVTNPSLDAEQDTKDLAQEEKTTWNVGAIIVGVLVVVGLTSLVLKKRKKKDELEII